MRQLHRMIRSTSRQIAITVGVIGLTFAAGIEWAEAAEAGVATGNAMPGELHVVFLFLLTLGLLAATVFRPLERVKVRGRPEIRRSRRR